MAKYAEFDAYAIDSTTLEEVAFLGKMYLSALDWVSNATTSNAGINITNNVSEVQNYATGTWLTTRIYGPNYTTAIYDFEIRYIETFVVSNLLFIPSNIGSIKIKAVNTVSGYYAILTTAINTVSGVGSASSWYIYDNEGTELGNISIWTVNWAFNSSTYKIHASGASLSCVFNDNMVSSIKQVLSVTATLGSSLNMNIILKASTGVIPSIAWLNAVLNYTPPAPPSPGGDDPYDDIPESGPGSGDGSFDFDDTDPIDFGSLPALSAVSTGFISLWCPNNTQINKLSSFMWNASGSVINFLKNLIADPLDLIMGLHIVPLEVTPVGTDTVTVGLINTGVEMDYIESQWAVVDCGTLNINETWGAYLDYDPYTKMEIYLPYCGTHPLRVDDFMTGTMQVLYNVDLMSGSCVAMIKNADSVLYTFMGQCATDIPVTAEQYGNIFKSITQLGANIGETAAAGPVAIPGAVSSAVDTVMGLKPSIGRSGAIGGAAGIMSPQKPYIILTRPRQAHPENQNVYMGYPSIYTAELSDLSGYTVIEHIHLEGIGGTQAELNELENILHTGVIF